MSTAYQPTTTVLAPSVLGIKTYGPSPQQQAVLDWVLNGEGCLNLIARAGCGKTSALKMVVTTLLGRRDLNPRGIHLMAFNKPIADEITAWLAEEGILWNIAKATTVHSAGVGAWRKVAPNCKVDDKKVNKLCDRLLGGPQAPAYRDSVIKAVGLAKQSAFGFLHSVEDRAEWFKLIEHNGIDEELVDDNEGVPLSVDRLVTLCIGVYNASLKACRETIDYSDMILAPLVFNARMWGSSWVLMDEAQDTNPARRALALKLLAPGGRLIAVGDDRQAIYGFTGADADSLDLIKAELNSDVLPLNVTYRCPKAVVRVAQTWVPDIRAHETAPEGIYRTIHEKEIGAENWSKTDAILCRNTEPLVEMAYSLLRRGIGCRIEGKAIGEGLVNLVKRFRCKDLGTLIGQIPDKREKEVQKWLAKGNETKAANVDDAYETILTLAQSLLNDAPAGRPSVDELVSYIDSLFGDTKEGEIPKVLTLSTVHKSKGREWDRVYILGRNLYMPSRYARKEWQQVQEENLMYVAVTRAKRELVDVYVEPPKRKKDG